MLFASPGPWAPAHGLEAPQPTYTTGKRRRRDRAKIDALEAQTDRADLGVTGGFARTATRQQSPSADARLRKIGLEMSDFLYIISDRTLGN